MTAAQIGELIIRLAVMGAVLLLAGHVTNRLVGKGV